MFNVEAIVEKWLQEHKDEILDNISATIDRWMEKNKEEIYDIIRESKGT
jgi:hypothetical protein